VKSPFSPRGALAWTAIACVAASKNALALGPVKGVDLVWIAPPECPDEASAKRAIEGYLGHRPLDAFKPLTVQVEITSVANGRFRGALAFGGESGGDRRFEGGTCERVSEAAALIVALTLDPVEVATHMQPPRAIESRMAGSVEKMRGSEDNTKAPRRFTLGLQTAGDVGSLPDPTLGAGFLVGLDWARASMAIDFTSWVARRAFRGPTPESGGELSLTTVSLRGCFAPFSAPVAATRLDVCARAEGGIAGGRGFGIVEPGSSHVPWAAGFVGLTVRSPNPSPLGVWLSIEGGLTVSRPRFFIEDFGRVFEASAVLARALLGVAWTFQ
jgi:hypothetical protein